MADTQWNIEHLLATAVAYMRDVGMPNEADAIIELQRRAATTPADAALAVTVDHTIAVPVGHLQCWENELNSAKSCIDSTLAWVGEYIKKHEGAKAASIRDRLADADARSTFRGGE